MATAKKRTAPIAAINFVADPVPLDGNQYVNTSFVQPEAPTAPEPEGRTVLGTIKDVGISALKGVIAVPEAAVGLADLVSGGAAGQALEGVGFRPREAKAMLDEGYSAPQKEAFRRVQAAEGLGNTFMEAISNPSVIGQSVVESLPLMGAGGVVARGAMAVAPKIASVVAAAGGEGAVMAGSAAEQIRQQTADGRLTAGQAGLAAAIGVVGAGFSLLGGKIAQKLGIADVDTLLAGAAKASPAAQKALLRRVLGGAVSEGVLEELPQSVSEQVLQNMALNKPLDEGLDQAAVLGLLSGSAMGGGANLLAGRAPTPQTEPPPPAPPPVAPPLAAVSPLDPTKPAGPLTRAANVAAATTLTGQTGADLLAIPDNPLLAGARVREEDRRQEDLSDKAMARLEQLAADDLQALNAARFEGQSKPVARATAAPAAMKNVAPEVDPGDIYPPEPGDILNPKGEPFKNKAAALTASKKFGGQVVQVMEGWAVRGGNKESANVGTTASAATVAAGNGGQLGADAAGGQRNRGRDDAGAGGGAGDAAPAAARRSQPGEPVRTAGLANPALTKEQNAATRPAPQGQAPQAEARAATGGDEAQAPAKPAAAGPAAVEAAGAGGEFSDLFDEQGRSKFSSSASVKEFKKRTGLGQDGVRAIQAAVQDGRPITLDEARQADIAVQERRSASLEQAKAASEAESRMAKENAAKPAEQRKLLGDYEIPGLEGAISRVRVFQQGTRIEAVGISDKTANNDLSRLIQIGKTVEQALAALYGDHAPNEAPNPSRVKRIGQPNQAKQSSAQPAQTGAVQAGQPAAPNAGGQVATPTNLREGLANIRAQKQQEAAQAGTAAGEAAGVSQSELERIDAEERIAKPALRKRIAEGKEPKYEWNTQENIYIAKASDAVVEGDASAYKIKLTLTPDEKRAVKRADADMTLADTPEERAAARKSLTDAFRPAVDRALAEKSMATPIAPAAPKTGDTITIDGKPAEVVGQTIGGVKVQVEGEDAPRVVPKKAAKADAGTDTAPAAIKPVAPPTNPPTQAQAGTLAEGAGESRPAPVAATVKDSLTPEKQKAHADAEVGEFMHNGTRIYQAKIAGRDGAPPTMRWAVESAENKQRRESGDRNRGGDSLHASVEDAKKAAEVEARQEREKAARLNEIEAREKQERDAAEARREANKGKTLTEIKADGYMAQEVKDGKTGDVLTRAEWVKRLVDGGAKLSVEMVNKIKPMSRAAFNRATNQEQAAHEKKVKAAGQVPEYSIGDFIVTKTEYDFAQKLVSSALTAPTKQEVLATQAERERIDREERIGKPALRERIADGKAPLLTFNTSAGTYAASASNAIREGDAKAYEVQLSPTEKERKAIRRAESDMTLADTPEERAAARKRLTDAFRPAVDRALAEKSTATPAAPTPKTGDTITVDAKPAGAIASPPKKMVEESQQEKVEKEWTANYDRVSTTDDLANVPIKDLERAENWAQSRKAREQRKGWDGGEVNQNLVSALQSEQDRIRAEVKRRNASVSPAPQAAAPVQPPAQPDLPTNPQNVDTSAEPVQKAPEIEQVGPFGRDMKPVAQGGKPFKTKAEADAFRKANSNNMRTVKQGTGFVLRELTPKELAAREKAAKRIAQPRAGQAGVPISAHEFVVGKGGLARGAMADAGFDRNMKVGNRWLFAGAGKPGLTLAEAAEMLAEAGYIREETETAAAEIIKRSIRTPQYTAEGWERIAEAEQATRFEDHLAAQQEAATEEDPFGPAPAFTPAEVMVVPKSAREEYAALMEAAEAAGVDVDAILEDAARISENQTQEQFNEYVRQALTDAIADSRREADRRESAVQGREDAERGGTEGSRQDAGRPGAQEESGISSQQLAAAQEELRILRGYANQRLIPSSTTLREVITTPLVGADRAINVNAKRYGIARALGLKVERIRQPRSDALVLKIVEGDSPLLDKTVAEIAAMKFIIQSEKQEKPLPALREQLSNQEQTENDPALTEPAETDRYAAGKALTKEQRKQVLGTLVDVYKAKDAPREQKGIGPSGNERYGYVHSPELFEKSDITGAMVRYYVTLPDGRIAHPSELFPDFTQAQIDTALIEQANKERREKEGQAFAERQADSGARASPAEADAAFMQRNRGFELRDWRTGKTRSFVHYEKDGRYYSVLNDDDAMMRRVEKAGWTRTDTLTAPTQQDVLTQQDRREQAEDLDQREQIQREASGFQLQAQAPEQRKDNTSDMFGGPTAEDVERARKPGKQQEDDGTAPLFSRGTKDQPRELIIQHNLTAENLLHAERMGGIPVPSLAITKAAQPLENFGEITLLGDADMATPRGDMKVFGADIYSPRYPSITYRVVGDAVKKINATLAPYRQEGDREYYGGADEKLDDLTSYRPFKQYAAEKAGWADPSNVGWDEMKTAATKLFTQAGAEERIFQGFTDSGNRRYKAHTLDNVIAILKKELRGGESFNYGAGSLRAKFTPQFRTIQAIRNSKDRLITKEAFEKVKDEINKELLDLSYDMVPNGGFRSSDTGMAILEDGARMGMRRAAKGYDIDLSDEQVERANEFLQKLRNLPTAYFEAKALRAMDLSEFKVAVVPDSLDPDARRALEKRGVKIVTYPKGDTEARNKAIADASADNGLMFSRAQPFYSALSQSIEGMTPKALPGAMWKDGIKGLINKGAVKEDEVEWSGIREWLDLQTGKVSKDQVLAYLDANGVQVQEVTLGGDGFYRDANGERVFDDETGDYIGSKNPGTKYENYTLPGGQNYREVLLTLPRKNTDALDARIRELSNWPKDPKTAKRAEDQPELDRLGREWDAIDRGTPAFKSGHWPEANILAHIRLNDRTDADGNRVLFVEEIQSDWGQEGKKKGFNTKVTPEQVAREVYGRDLAELDAAEREGVMIETEGRNEGTGGAAGTRSGVVPVAPFVTSTDKWLTLALKRVITMAAQEGYDRVAFVNGEQSAERYDLSKQVDKVEWFTRSGMTMVWAYPKNGERVGGTTQNGKFKNGQFNGKDIADVLGKEIAEKIANTPEDTTLTGDGLRVGGHGMISFYDKILPNTLKDVLKKVGGQGLETVEVGVGINTDDSEIRWTEYGDGTQRVEWDGGEREFETEDEARAFRDGLKTARSAQPGFTITPAMREKASAGLPLFRKGTDQTTGLTPTQFTQALSEAFGAKVADRLQSKGVVVPLADQTKLPAHVVPFLRDGDIVFGFYDPRTNRTYAVLENLTPDMVKGLAMHEVGVHYGFEAMLGADKYKQVMKQLDLMRRSGNVAVQKAHAEAVANAARPSQVPEETLAYLVQEAPNNSVIKDVIARIKAWLFREFGIGGKYLTERDLHMLARAAVQHAARTEPGGVEVPAFMRAYHGTPHAFDKFSTDKIGTGEGAQAYGWGLYFAGKKEIAEHYRTTLAARANGIKVNGVEVMAPSKPLAQTDAKERAAIFAAMAVRDGRSLESKAREIEFAVERARTRPRDLSGFQIDGGWGDADTLEGAAKILRQWSSQKIEPVEGRLYEVEIPEEGEYLLWDKPLSEQPAKVREALGKARALAESKEQPGGITIKKVPDSVLVGEGLYGALARAFEKPQAAPTWTSVSTDSDGRAWSGQRAASEALSNLGIKGIKYLDGVSRNKSMKDVKREFLSELPEDADFDEVMDLIGQGTFSPANEAILTELAANDWLGFDYPAQAISAALSGKLSDFDASPALVKAVADAQDGGTYNYVIFSADDVAIQNQPAFMRQNEGMANRKDVVGNQGGRSADDISPGVQQRMVAAYNNELKRDGNDVPPDYYYREAKKADVENIYASMDDVRPEIRAALERGESVIEWGSDSDGGLWLKSEAPTEDDFFTSARRENDWPGPVTSIEQIFSNPNVNESAAADAFSELAESEGWSVHGSGRYFEISKENPDVEAVDEGYEFVTLNVRISNHSRTANASRPTNAKSIDINMAPQYGNGNEFHAADDWASAVKKMRTASFNKNGDLSFTNESPAPTRKGAPTPDTSLKQGRPDAGMQERPTVRAVSGSLGEPAQSGGGAGSEVNRTSFDAFVKKYRESQPLDTYEHKRELARISNEIVNDWRNGNTDEFTRTYGPREIVDQMRQEDEAKYFDADGDQTDAGNLRYSQIEEELSQRLAREYLGEPERKTVDLRKPGDAAKALIAYLESEGMQPGALGGSGKSQSQYFDLNGETVRISDHQLPFEYGQASHDLVLGDVGNDVRSDGRMTSVGISESEAQSRISRFADSLLNESPAPNPDGAPQFSRTPQTETKAFKDWFGDSKVVDDEGRPLVVYHGTATPGFSEFDPKQARSEGGAFFFSHSSLMKNPATNANGYATRRGGAVDDGAVMPVYLRMTNPLIAGFTEPMPEGDEAIVQWLDRMQKFNRKLDANKNEYYERTIKEAKRNGHDGVIFKNVEDERMDGGRRWNDETDVYAAFRPEQIKSATGNRGTFDPKDPDIRFLRGDPAPRGAKVVAVQQFMDSITEKWSNAPTVIVAANMQDPLVPKAVRDYNEGQKSQGAEGEPMGFFYDGKVYVLAGSLNSPQDALTVLAHEALGHYGLRGMFGDRLDGIKTQIIAMRKKEVLAKVKAYGLDPAKREDLMYAAEEVLAEMAQTVPSLGFVKRAVAIVRQWLRENIPGFDKMKLTDDEIINQYIVPARGWVVRGRESGAAEPVPAFMRQNEVVKSQGSELAVRRLNKVMREAGWEIEYVDMDLTAEKPTANIRINRDDGRFLIAKVDSIGRGTMETFQRERGLRMDPSQRGRRPLSPMVDDVFLGRQKFEGARAMLRGMTNYLADNATNPVALSDMRSAWASVMSGPVRQDAPQLSAPTPDGAPEFSRTPQTETKAFKDWFGDSKVVDDEGRPLVVYHSSTFGDFSTFDKAKQHKGMAGYGFYFSDADGANIYADYGANFQADKDWQGNEKKLNIMPVYLAIQNPLVADNIAEVRARFGKADPGNFGQGRKYGGMSETAQTAIQRAGYDGVIANEYVARQKDGSYKVVEPGAKGAIKHPVYVAFEPNQIKSALGNRGTFDPKDPDIRFSRGAAGNVLNANTLRTQATERVSDFFAGMKAPGKLNWWHKTIGTQYNLAQRYPRFKRVFDAAQNFLNDVSFYATEAADLAPKILPKLETWRDIAKSPISAEDNKAIAAPIFEGTLKWTRVDGDLVETDDVATAGVVWSDAELESRYNLTPQQIGLYREFRAAVDKSLTNLAISDMVRFAGRDAAPIRSVVMGSSTVAEAERTLVDYLQSVADSDAERAEVLESTIAAVQKKAERAGDLMRRGYAPLSRFGQYTLDVIDNGERVYFGLFESAAEAAKMARRMRANFPGAEIARGTVSQEEYKLFAGVSPETVELFGDLLGLEAQGDSEADKAFQTYIKVAKANRSSMKRLITRKGMAGFSEDAGRVLAGFVYSNARQTSQNLHMGELTEAAMAVNEGDARGDGELKDRAAKLVEYVKNPVEEAQAFRSLLFVQYLGGSVASALVNMTQPIQVTLPYLSQFGGPAKAAGQMRKALTDVWKNTTGDARLDAALKRAEEEGLVAPQEVHQLMAQAQGKGSLQSGDGTVLGDASAKASNALSKLALGWGKFFGAAEQFNRRVTFIAAYRTAVDQGIARPADFAEKALAETQFLYNKGNKPQWARGAVGSTLFVFKQYSISYVELMNRMWQSGPEGKKAVLLAMGLLFLVGGAGGLPFVEDAEDLLDAMMQRLGYNYSTKLARRQFFERVVGKEAARFMERGISGLPGAPLDVSGRLGMGNLIPGTGLLVQKQDSTRDVTELAGPAGDFIGRLFKGANQALQGEVGQAAVTVSPAAARNAAKAVDMYATGIYKDERGRKVLDVDAYDAAIKFIGFQPNDVARVQQASQTAQKLISQVKVAEAAIADRWAKALAEGDADGVKAAREELRDWNRKNPETPIRIAPGQINKRVKAMRQDKSTRLEKTAPREIRNTVREELRPA